MFRQAVNERWTYHSTRKRSVSSPPSEKLQAACIDSTLIDIVDFMAEYPTIITEVRQTGELLVKVSEDGPSKGDGRRKLVESHFWCELLAQLAGGMDDLAEQTAKVPEHVKSTMFQNEDTPEELSGHYPQDLAPLVDLVSTGYFALPFFTQLDQALLVLRILAVLVCPAPEHHPSVQRPCMQPLTREVISELAVSRLKEVFPEDWLTTLRAAL
jgi:hypothetical protein